MALEGMVFGVGLIILMIGLLHFSQKEKIELGVICTIIGSGSFYSIYFDQLTFNFLYNFFFSDYRAILVPSLAYIYFLRRADFSINIVSIYAKHLITPLVVLITYWVLKFSFSEFFTENVRFLVLAFRSSAFLITLIYFIIGLNFLRRIKVLMKPAAYRNFALVYKLILGHLLLVLLILCAEAIRSNAIFPKDNKLSTNIITIINLISYIPILLFATLELTLLKKYFFNELFVKESNSNLENEIIQFIDEELMAKKLFTEEDFSLSVRLKTNQISESEFRKYIKAQFGENLTEFTNRLKVEHFKKLLSDPENERYDLPGLAKMSGFNSKATFYRVFKQLVGTTPNEYKDSLKKEL